MKYDQSIVSHNENKQDSYQKKPIAYKLNKYILLSQEIAIS